MKYLSVCSGIEAATVAWHPLGWTAVAFAEIEKFPSAVLAHHYPHVPNFGDMTQFRDWPDANIDVLVGGTPCQSFSVAGLRKGLADPRGNLALVYLAIADRYRPNWIVWENVPGVLSSNKGRDFGAFLGGLAELGYGFAYRVLDAQFVRVDGLVRAVPQRRRRVFVVGYLGDWRRAAAVLFERESLSWNSAPRREAGQSVAPTISARPTGGGGLGTDFDCDGGLIPCVAGTLKACAGKSGQPNGAEEADRLIPVLTQGGVSLCLNAGGMGRIDAESETLIPMQMPRGGFFDGDVAHALRAEGFDASEDGTGRGTPLVPIIAPQVAQTLTRGAESAGKGGYAGRRQEDDANLVAFDMRGREGGSQFEGPHDTANIRAASGGSSRSYIATRYAVRRLMPIECERLQGFPDGYTDITYRGKIAADGPRYKALGNSMAVNVMRWIGSRIQMVDVL